MKTKVEGAWMWFRRVVPGKVQISILLISTIIGIALWAGWVDPGLDHFVIEVFVAVGLFVYAIFVSLEADDHLDRLELIGVMLTYAVFNFYVRYELTGQDVEIPIVGGQMAGASSNLVQLGQWFVGVGIIGLVFNLLVDRDTAFSNLAWHWKNNPVVFIVIAPIFRSFREGMTRWRGRINGLDFSFPKPSLPDGLRRRRPASDEEPGSPRSGHVENEAFE